MQILWKISFVATTLILLVSACGSGVNSPGKLPEFMGNSDRKMTEPAEDAHWTMQMAYEVDGIESDPKVFFGLNSVTEEPSKLSFKLLDDQPFGFQWKDSGECQLLRSFTLLEDGTTVVTRTSYYETVQEGKTVMMPEFIVAEFKATKSEIQALRKVIQEARLGDAPRKYKREIFDGTHWEMYLRVGDKTKYVWFANAFPERFRDVVVTAFREICSKHSNEIDKVQKKKDFAVLTGTDEFGE